jgi:hypothetical protein
MLTIKQSSRIQAPTVSEFEIGFHRFFLGMKMRGDGMDGPAQALGRARPARH